MTILVAIAGLAFLILIHEAGHFFTALAVGMRPRRFYIGFPPALVKKMHKGVEYGIGVVPLGGYVKIPGMHRPAASDMDVHFSPALHEEPRLLPAVERVKRPLAESDFDSARVALEGLAGAIEAVPLSAGAKRSAERGVTELADALGADSYWRQRTWKRLVVIGAGPAANLIFAVLLLALVYMIGIPSVASRQVQSVEPNTPAAQAGLRPGDTIVAINRLRTTKFDDVRTAIQNSKGQPLVVAVNRGRNPYMELKAVRPVKRSGVYILGFRPTVIRYKHYGPVSAFRLAGGDTWAVTKAMGNWLTHVTSPQNRKEISTPVGIVRTSSEAVQSGFRDYLAILALISLSLALLNLLPLLPLDGGHIAFSLIEGLRGKAVSRVVYERVSMIGIALILFIYVIGITNDIGNIRGG
ncbi:MAG TPA: site-2 protease family protein [Gaiellaceae bacterium]|nr:site-2 protease family protein [Gaiellaceae bacterium]